MQCPTCATVNPAQARFCIACGILLVSGAICGACHTLSPPHARYCYHCGSFLMQAAGMAMPQAASLTPAPPAETAPDRAPALSLKQLPPPRPLAEMLPSLNRFLPKALYEPLERRPKERHLIQARDHLAALLGTAKTYLPRPVVLAPQPAGVPAGGMYRGVFLFGDVSGFTPLSEQLKRLGQEGAERITQIINQLFTELVQVLFAHGGSLLKFGGDALLGLFPAETDEEMAAGALKAVQAGLAMQEVMQQEQFAAIEAAGETRVLTIKCGISAGPFFAAHIGAQKSMAYVTTGHTVNLAEQAEGHANPGDVVMTQDAYDLIAKQLKVGPPKKDPQEGFFLVQQAPPVEGTLSHAPIVEPPAGDVNAQITYLVDRMDRLAPYLNAELLRRIVTNPGDARISPDHRPVTVMFVNYRGISELIEKAGRAQPELIIQQLNDYFVHMAQIVERYEGTLARMDQYAVGDRLVIFFGAPRAHEDDPVRAVYTALDMQKAVREHFGALRTPAGVYRFEQRIGINTGHLFAGNAGAPDLRQEYTLMGDDINMAARLMSYASWRKIYISNKTQERVAAYFELSERFDLKVKGKAILIPTYAVLGRRDEIGQTRGLASGQSPLTGRDSELETLQKVGQTLLKGRGQILSIMGDSGLGKSRSKRELKQWLLGQEEADRVLWLEGQALSFSEQMSYWLVAQVLRGLLALEADANQDDVLFALWERGEELLGDEAMDAIPFLAHLMGLELGNEWRWVKELDPKVRQKQTFWAAKEFIAAAAQQRPTVIALDDLHWADEASLTLMEELLQVTDQAPLLFCLVFRARRDKGCWRLRNKAASDFPHRYTEVQLKPLSRELGQHLLRQLVPGAQFRAQIKEEILDKAAGNPFYLEEVVRSLLDDGAVVPDPDQTGRWRVVPEKIEQINVPDTLQAAIVARIDRLTEDARRALQMASVIGRQFQLDLLRNLAQAEAELDTLLAQLERGGLIRPHELAADPIYAFPDTLVQEVAYESLLVKSRRQFHRQIGETLASIFADRPEQECELLAYHFYRSDDKEQAIKYLEMAAQKAKDSYANAIVIQHYSKLLEIKQELGDEAGQANALYQMGVMAYEMGDYCQARPWLEQASALYQALGDQANEGWSVMYLGMVDLKQANYDQSSQHHQAAIKLAQSRQDMFQEGIHLTNAARVSLRMGAYDRAMNEFRRSLKMKKQMKDLMGQGFAYFYMGLIHTYQDQYDQAKAAFQSSLELWQQVEKNERGLSYCQHGLGRLALAREQFDQAEGYFQKAHDISSKLVLKAEIIENLSFLGQARLGLGKLDAAVEVSNQAVALLAAQKDVEEVQQIYFNHYRVLTALQDPAAADQLKQACTTMMDQAERIVNNEDRQVFLDKVRVNQEINAQISG